MMEVDPAPQGGTGSVSGLLGIDESELDDLKSAAKPALLPGQLPRAKRPKLKNTDFFDDDRGFKKLIKTFPSLKYRGKGYEMQDLNLLLSQYEIWLKDLYPIDEHFENMVWKARSVLMEREISDEGEVSDPRERLHMLRYEYKRAGGAGTNAAQARLKAERERAEEEAKRGVQISDEARKRMEANRQRALELKKKREAGQAGGDAAAPAAASSSVDDVKLRIEANRLRAMELKRKREEEEAMRAELAAQAEMEAMFEEPGGPGGPSSSTMTTVAAEQPQAAAKVPVRTSFDDDEDPFGWGGDFDDPFDAVAPAMPPPQAASAPPAGAVAQPPAAAPPPGGFPEEEEDPFGFGFGFD